MRALHNTSVEAFRNPFGAIFAGESVDLAVDVWDEPAAVAWLRLWIEGEGERLVPMERTDGGEHGAIRFAASVKPDRAGALWYRFNIAAADGAVWQYGATGAGPVGAGDFAMGEPPSFLLQVLEGERPDADEPSVSDDIAYRFPGGKDGREAARAGLGGLKPLGITMPAPPEPGDSGLGAAMGDAIVDFATRKKNARQVAIQLEMLRETCVPGGISRAEVALGGPDRDRLLTRLGDAPAASALSPSQRAAFSLNRGQHDLAVSRLWIAALLQMSLPGIPCVYGGDEQGREGFARTLEGVDADAPSTGWDANCFTVYRNAIGVRKSMDALARGSFEPIALNDDVMAVWRRTDRAAVCVIANQSTQAKHTVRVPMEAGCVDDVIGGKPVPVRTVQGRPPEAEVFLWPLGTAVLYFHDEQRLQKPLEPGTGIICHITSLPNLDGPGTLGKPAKRFVDWLAGCGYSYWQVLPINPADAFGSPYAGPSAFAGNKALLEGGEKGAVDRIGRLASDGGYRAFEEANRAWLLPYATFSALKAAHGGAPWWEWPERCRSWDPRLAEDPSLASRIEVECCLQYEFHRQWNDLRAYANDCGISIIGDMPMYVSADSADVWAHRGMFDVDEGGTPSAVAGCPPDPLSADGQIWGSPTYRWSEMRATGYGWWMDRFARAFACYDYVRLDHFLGFSSFYSIPQGKRALDGAWNFGPGLDLFQHAYDAFGPLPLVAEDLGIITPAVRALRAQAGFMGMEVIQFDDADPRGDWRPLPDAIVYTSTHDTSTLVGWMLGRYCGAGGCEPDAEALERARGIARELRRKIAASGAKVAIMQLQDALGLDDSARMNVPGVASGNWAWQAPADLPLP
ncbi:4-alpha-glucanotransferase [Curtanaerobium respiraculi]|uniref:4-alpha-glucanotransferase n=1 Tax=Curtanaerobium respiraculi TaxID=2949669 RepID=UPI0024B3A5B9|nr:4-alpha-glucanotransferase [Curtanaerobium respiraculi]